MIIFVYICVLLRIIGFYINNTAILCANSDAESDDESTDSNSSEETIKASSYQRREEPFHGVTEEEPIQKESNETKSSSDDLVENVERINEDIGQLVEELHDLQDVLDSIEKLPLEKKHYHEDLELYREEHPDLFDEENEYSVEQSLSLIKDEKVELIKEKEQEIKAIESQINDGEDTMESVIELLHSII